jgi:exodeoxyribonuclease V alpha subunit
MTPDTAALLATLKAWSEPGWVRRLDHAFAAFVVDLCPDAGAPVVLAAALVAHLEGRGHSCLQVDALLRDADGLLGWPPQPGAELQHVLAGLPRGAEDWLVALRASPLVAVDTGGPAPPDPIDAAAPLVLRGSKLYLRRYWRHERRVAAQVLERGAAFEAVDVVAARPWLDRLFPGPPAGEPGVDWQKIACGIALRGRLSVITGGPGTGKTYTAARLLALLFAVDAEPQRLRVALAAPTGKAAARLKQSIDASLQELQARLGDSLALAPLAARIGPARTLHSLLGARPDTRRFRADAAHPLEVDVLIVDEASMIHLEMMSALLDALPPRARVVFLGDKDQLASVEAGAVLGDLCSGAERGRYAADTAAYVEAVSGQCLPAEFVTGGPALAQQTVMLRESRRFGGPIGRLALAVNRGDAAAAASLLNAATDPSLHWLAAPAAPAVVRLAVQGRAGAEGGYGSYLDALRQRPGGADAAGFDAWVLAVLTAFDRFRVLCAVHDGDWGTTGLNQAIERALVAGGRLAKRGEWYEGRPVMVTRNDPGVGVFNGDIGIVLRPLAASVAGAAGASLRAYFLDGQAVRSVGVSRLANVETAFAMTVHKSQGSEFEHTVLVLPAQAGRGLTRELVYTGITRARQAFTLATGRAPAFAEALARRTQRSSGLLELLGDTDVHPQADDIRRPPPEGVEETSGGRAFPQEGFP